MAQTGLMVPLPKGTHCVLQSMINQSIVNSWLARADQIYDEIHSDYFYETSRESFIFSYLDHTSLISRIAAWRFFANHFYDQIRTILLDDLVGTGERYLFGPLAFLRCTFPEMYRTPSKKKALCCSAPHFDRSFEVYGHTIWIPLVNLTSRTGGLCFFYDRQIIDLFSDSSDGSKQDYYSYYENTDWLDPMLKKNLTFPKLKKGSVAIFDSDVLHGSVKSQSSWRQSFDFRIFHRSQLSRLNPINQRIVQTFNQNPRIALLFNLAAYGDHLGVERILNQFKPDKSHTRLLNQARKLGPGLSLRDPSSNLPYLVENEWLKIASSYLGGHNSNFKNELSQNRSFL